MNERPVMKIFADGRGPSPDGHKPAFAWVRADGTAHAIEERDGITSNEAEYLAILAAVEAAPANESLEIATDSLLAKAQLNREYRIRDVKLTKLAGQIRTVASQKNILLRVSWVPRKDNLAGRLL